MDLWEFKQLEMQEGRVVEDGEPVEPRMLLRERSIELITQGWEPLHATETIRHYRRLQTSVTEEPLKGYVPEQAS